MSESGQPSSGRGTVPPPQRGFRDAADRALAAVRLQAPDQLEWLGAGPAGQGAWTLPVLNEALTLDLASGALHDSAGGPVGPWWRVLALHYLAVPDRPVEQPPAVTFADLPAGRAYAPVYRRRVVERLCHTAGRDPRTLLRAGQALGGRAVEESADLTLDFRVFPRLPVRLAWYAGEEDLPPSAALLLPGNVESFLCVEDIVVLSERLVSRLSGGRF